MPPTYPGVFIEEIPSGPSTITGVATSITAFIGRALKGPVNGAVTCNSYGDFERIFGGLWLESSMSYAVRDFYLNGGSQAIIVRLFHPSEVEEGEDSIVNRAQLDANGLLLEAASEGTWGNDLRARVDYNTSPMLPNEDGDSLFNLSIRNDATGQIEVHRNVSVIPNHVRQVDRVLGYESTLARVSEPLPDSRPATHPDAQPGGNVWATDPDNLTNSIVSAIGSDGDLLTNAEFLGSQTNKTGIYALEHADLFNLLCIPPYDVDSTVDFSVINEAATYCEKRRAMLIVDPPSSWTTVADAVTDLAGVGVGTVSKNAALYFPRLRQPNPLRDDLIEDFAPCGAVAGVMARSDATVGVWKAPAGVDATLVGVPALSVSLTDGENRQLNSLGVNCLRTMPTAGRVVWGARTLHGNDALASEWKYIPVRRTALFIEESVYRGTQWVVFEPNDEPLWAQIRLNLGIFMHNLFRQSAFQGKTPREAYFVKCDDETTTQNDINLGIVNIIVGFAPLKPAEFVIIKLQQIAGQIEP